MMEAGARDERVPQWGVQETRELISARGEIEREAVAARRSAKTMWEAVAARLRERGYRRTADQCKCKWKNLVNRYKVLSGFCFSNELCSLVSMPIIWLFVRSIGSNDISCIILVIMEK